MFEKAAAFVADSLPTSFIMLTMPTGPDRSLTPTAPANRSLSPIQTMRTKSIALYHVVWSLAPNVAGFVPK